MAKDTKKLIIEKTVGLFKSKGYDNTTVEAICKECGITKGTFYYHFKNKEEVATSFYSTMYEKSKDHLMKELNTTDNALERLWKLYAYSIDQSRELSASVLKAFYVADFTTGLTFFSPLRKSAQGKISQMAIEIIKQGQEKGEIRQGDPESMHLAFLASEFSVAYDWAFHNGEYEEKTIIYQMFRTIFE